VRSYWFSSRPSARRLGRSGFAMNHLPKMMRSASPDSTLGAALSRLKPPAAMNLTPPFCNTSRKCESELTLGLMVASASTPWLPDPYPERASSFACSSRTSSKRGSTLTFISKGHVSTMFMSLTCGRMSASPPRATMRSSHKGSPSARWDCCPWCSGSSCMG
jgi:hypothetical protein